MKRIDRLFLIAHDKDRAPHVASSAFARREFPGKLVDYVPLRGTRVLGFIHKDMVDPAIQTVEHPFGLSPVGQQCAGARDQVVEIQPAAGLFGLFIAAQKCVCETVEDNISFNGFEREPGFARRLDPLIEVFQPVDAWRQCAFPQFRGWWQAFP